MLAKTTFPIVVEEVERINAVEYASNLTTITQEWFSWFWEDDDEYGNHYIDTIGTIHMGAHIDITYTDLATGKSKTLYKEIFVPHEMPEFSLDPNSGGAAGGYLGAEGIFRESCIIDLRTRGSFLGLMFLTGTIWGAYSTLLPYYADDNTYDFIDIGRIFVPVARLRNNPELKIETLPDKTSYRAGETIDYTGLKVVLDYNDAAGTKLDVTNLLRRISPSAGSTMPAKNTKVYVHYYAYVGTLKRFDYQDGYVDGDNWIHSGDEAYYSNIHAVDAGQEYTIALGEIVGDRFSVIFTTIDVTKADSDVSGVGIANIINPAANASVTFTPPASGYIVITKDASEKSGIETYVLAHGGDDWNLYTEFTLTLEGA